MATTHLDTAVSTSPYSIPLLDASSLPYTGV